MLTQSSRQRQQQSSSGLLQLEVVTKRGMVLDCGERVPRSETGHPCVPSWTFLDSDKPWLDRLKENNATGVYFYSHKNTKSSIGQENEQQC